MKSEFRDFNPDEMKYFDDIRAELRSRYPEEHRHEYDKPEGKLALIDQLLRNNDMKEASEQTFHAVGVCFGDAIVAKPGFQWAVFTDQFGTRPVIRLPGKSLNFAAFTAIEKRVKANEPVEIVVLFNAVCHELNSIMAPRRSLFSRLFDSRLK